MIIWNVYSVSTYWRKISIKFSVPRKFMPTKWKHQAENAIATNFCWVPLSQELCQVHWIQLFPKAHKKRPQPLKIIKFSWYRRRNKESDSLTISLKVIWLVKWLKQNSSPDLPDLKPASQRSVYQTVVSKFIDYLIPPIEKQTIQNNANKEQQG